jgi:hypothetical protein
MGSARWAGTNTACLNTACERHGPTCLVLVPGTTRPPCPCWAGIPTRQQDTGTARSNGRHGPRHDGRWISATPPCDRWNPASPPFLYKGQRRPSTPSTLTLVHLHAPSSLSSLAAAALPHPPPPTPPWIGILNHSFSLLVGDVASSSPPFPLLTDKRRIPLRSASVRTYIFFTTGFPRFLSIRGARGLQAFDLPLHSSYSNPNYD